MSEWFDRLNMPVMEKRIVQKKLFLHSFLPSTELGIAEKIYSEMPETVGILHLASVANFLILMIHFNPTTMS